MADNESDDLELEVKKEEGGNSNMKLMIMMAVMCLVSVGLAVGLTLMLVPSGNAAEEDSEEASEEIVEPAAKAIYYKIKPAFVVNFQGRKQTHYLQVTVEVMARSQDSIDAVQQHLPLIKNNLVGLFSVQKIGDLTTHQGKEQLREQALEEIQKILTEEIGEPGVEAVLFTSFVVQ